MEGEITGRVTPEKAVEILKKNGFEVSLEQARLILDFLYKIANVAVAKYLKDEDR